MGRERYCPRARDRCDRATRRLKCGRQRLSMVAKDNEDGFARSKIELDCCKTGFLCVGCRLQPRLAVARIVLKEAASRCRCCNG